MSDKVYDQIWPLGVMPRDIHERKRMEDIYAAIARYQAAGLTDEIPDEWVEELHDLHFGIKERAKDNG